MPDFYQTYYRNYDPNLGRFLGVDPIAEATDYLTVYNYSGNNPVMFNDPLGNLRNTYGRQIYYSAVPPSGTSETNPEGWAAWDYQNGVIDTYRFGEIIEYYKEKRDREERTGEISLYDEKGGGLFDLAEFATFLSGVGSGEGGGRNIIISPEGKVLSNGKPDPLQKDNTYAISSDWDPTGGVSGKGTGTVTHIDAKEALSLIQKYEMANDNQEKLNVWDYISPFTHIIGPFMAHVGQPIRNSKRFIGEGSSIGTSPASKLLSKKIPYQSSVRLWSPVVRGKGLEWVGTKTVGRFLGRWFPWVGWALLAYDVYDNRQVIYDGFRAFGMGANDVFELQRKSNTLILK